MKKVFVVILNWNRPELTIECVKSVVASSKQQVASRIIVVDNNSDDGSVAKIKKALLHTTDYMLLVNKINKGFAGGNNVGIRHALKKGADYVLILNNDTEVSPGFLGRMMEVVKDDSSIGIISPKIYFAKGYEFHKRSLLDPSKERYKKEDLGKVIWYAGGKIDWDNVYGSGRGVDEIDKGQYGKIEKTDYATGTCMLISRKLLKKVGMFDERYYLYYEDTDLSVRAKMAGFGVVYNPNAAIWHKVAQSSGIGSGLNDYYITRNRMLFGMKYARLRTKFALLRQSINLLLTGRKWQKIGIRDFYLGRFGKGSFWGYNPNVST